MKSDSRLIRIAAYKRKGYTLRSLAQTMKEKGLPIHASSISRWINGKQQNDELAKLFANLVK